MRRSHGALRAPSFLGLCLGLVAAAPARAQLADPIPAPIPPSGLTIGLEPVAGGLVAPVAATFAPGHKDTLFVADQVGAIWAVDVSRRGERQPMRRFADLSARMVPLGLFGIFYDERGLLGLAFHPDFRRNGLLYTYTSEPALGVPDFTTLPPGAASDSHSVVTEWRVVDPKARELVLDPLSARPLLRVDQPQFNHKGGALQFGPDDLLYVSLGDGGAADDQGPGHVAGGNGQSLEPGNLLGKILRIDPLGRDSANASYGIPRDNPFLGAGVDEVYAYGFRNPFRFSFDARTGALWVGDVGQNDIEEVDVVVKGGNYGWPIKEGTFRFDDGGAGPGFVTADSPGAPAALADPVAQYDHDGPAGTTEGIAVVGGFVYRGSRVHALRGRYVFGDYSRAFARPQGRLLVLQDGPCGGTPRCVAELAVDGRAALGLAVLGLGEDGRRELYVLGNATGVLLGETGVVLRITRAGDRGGGDDED